MSIAPTGPLSGARMSYVFILARDFPLLFAFYRDTLGFEPYFHQPGECAFFRTAARAGGTVTPGTALAIYAGRDPAETTPTHWFLVFDVDDVDTAATTLRHRGVEVGPVQDGSTERYAKFSDPEGNVIEIHAPKTAA